MHEVIADGYIKVFRILLEHARKEKQLLSGLEDQFEQTPLKIAIIFDRQGVLELMFRYSYDLQVDASLT